MMETADSSAPLLPIVKPSVAIEPSATRARESWKAYCDESFSQGDPERNWPTHYVFASVTVGETDRGVLREAVAAFGPRFKASKIATRGSAEKLYAMLDLLHQPTVKAALAATDSSFADGMEQARSRCLMSLVEWHLRECPPLTEFILDDRSYPGSKEPLLNNRRDEATYSELRSRGVVPEHVNLRHRTDDDEPLLWLADALAFAYRTFDLRGDDRYWKSVVDVVGVELCA